MEVKNSANNRGSLLGRIPSFLLLSLLTVLFLQSCSSSAEVIVVSEEPKVLVPVADQNAGPAEELPEPNGILRIGSPYSVQSYDPLFAQNPTELRVISLLYDRLFWLNEAGEPVPYLVSQWERSEDGLTYTFLLRTDLFYHDSELFSNGKGRRISAQDVKEMIERTTDPNVPSLGRELLTSIAGLNEMSQERFEIKNPLQRTRTLDDAVQVLNSTTLQIQLHRPDPRFIYKLASPVLSVYPPEAVQHSGLMLHTDPVGSGPYEVSRKQGSVLVLTRSVTVHTELNLPYIDWNRIDFRELSSDLDAVNGILEGELDWAPDAGPDLGQLPDKEMAQPLEGSSDRRSSEPARLERFNSFVISVYRPLATDALSSTSTDPSEVLLSNTLTSALSSICSVEILASDVKFDPEQVTGFTSPFVEEWVEHLELSADKEATSGLSETVNSSPRISSAGIEFVFRDGFHTQLTNEQSLRQADPTRWNKEKVAEFRCIQPALLRKGADLSTIGLENSPVTWRIPNRITP